MPWILALLACGERQVYDEPIPVDDTFVRGDTDPARLARYEAAAAYSASAGGRAVMVLEGDTVVFEEGQNGLDLSDPNELFSGTKSFSCAISLAAEQDGLLDVEAPVADTLDEWAGDAEKEQIRATELLHFTSGLKERFWSLTWDGFKVDQRVADKYAFAVEQPVTFDPGSEYNYNGTDLLVFGALVESLTSEDPVDYLFRRVLDPIGMRVSGWNRDPEGHPMLAYGAWTTANEWARYGVLVRDDGAWKGEQVLPAGAFSRCFEGSEPMPAYGRTFWLNAEVDDDQAKEVPTRGIEGGQLLLPHAPADLVMAAGAHDNRLYVIPSLDLVIVRLGDGSRDWRDDAFLELALGELPP